MRIIIIEIYPKILRIMNKNNDANDFKGPFKL